MATIRSLVCKFLSLFLEWPARPRQHGKTGHHFLNHYSLKNSPTRGEDSFLNMVEWILLHQFLVYLTFCLAPRKENIRCRYAKTSSCRGMVINFENFTQYPKSNMQRNIFCTSFHFMLLPEKKCSIQETSKVNIKRIISVL